MSHLLGMCVLGADVSADAEQAFRLRLSILEHKRAQVSQGGIAESAGIVSFATLDDFLREMKQSWAEAAKEPQATRLARQLGILSRLADAERTFDQSYLDDKGEILPRYRITQNPVRLIKAPVTATTEGLADLARRAAQQGEETIKGVVPWYVWAAAATGIVTVGGGIAWKFAR